MGSDVSQALTAYLRDRAAEDFRWAVSDCATFGIGWAEVLAGRPVMLVAPLPGSLRAFMRRQETLPLVEEVGRVLAPLGFRPVPVDADALPGDIAVAACPWPGSALFKDFRALPSVLIRGQRAWCGRAQRGLVAFAPDARDIHLEAVWRV